MKSIFSFSIVLAMILAMAGLIGALCSGLGVRLGFWEFRTGFSILRWSVYAAGAGLVLAGLGLGLTKFAGGSLSDWRLLGALMLGLVVFAVPYFTVKDFRKIPTIADATTNIEDPPTFVALVPVREKTAKNPLAYRRDEAATLQLQYFPDLITIESDKTPADAITDAQRIAENMGLEIVDAAPGEGRLEATDTTFWFGFKDDVVVRARLMENGRTAIDIRSASRVGRLDGGVNGKRIQRMSAVVTEKP
jgi:hypothetical protein